MFAIIIHSNLKKNSMKKVLLVAAFTVAGFVGLNAQKDFKFGAGVT